jgi:hypothetical protein
MIPVPMPEPAHIDEPTAAAGYAAVLSRVAQLGQPVIVRRDGEDLAVVVSLEHLELIRDQAARLEAERIARELNWPEIIATNKPPQVWFEGDEPKPF